MIFRKSALIASILASIAGASQSEAACFGQRRCCQSTPVVCPSCPVTTYSAPSTVYVAPSQVYAAPSYSTVYAPQLVQSYAHEVRSCEVQTYTCCGGVQSDMYGYGGSSGGIVLRSETRTIVQDSIRSDVGVIVPQFIRERIAIPSGGFVDANIPANIGESEKEAFRDLYRKFGQADNGVQDNTTVNKIQEADIKRINEKIKTIPGATGN